MSVASLLLLLQLVWTTSVLLADEDCGGSKEFVCIDTVHYKVCLPPELKRVDGDEPVVRCPDATRCDDRSPWRCSSDTTSGAEPRRDAASFLCMTKGDFASAADGDCRNYFRCDAAGAEGASRRCEGDADVFDAVVGGCVATSQLTLDPRNAGCLPVPQQQLRSKRGVVAASPCGLQADCRRSAAAVTSEQDRNQAPTRLLDLLFEESDAAEERREKRDDAAASVKVATLLNAPMPKKNSPEGGGSDGKKQQQQRNLSADRKLKLKELQRKVVKDKAVVTEDSLQRGFEVHSEEKSFEGKRPQEDAGEKKAETLDLDWMDRVRELLEQVKQDKERWKMMRLDAGVDPKNKYRSWARVHDVGAGGRRGNYNQKVSDLDGETWRTRRLWTGKGKRQEQGTKLGGEEEKEADDGNQTFLFQDPAKEKEAAKEDQKRARGGGWRKGEGEHRKHHHHKHQHHHSSSPGRETSRHKERADEVATTKANRQKSEAKASSFRQPEVEKAKNVVDGGQKAAGGEEGRRKLAEEDGLEGDQSLYSDNDCAVEDDEGDDGEESRGGGGGGEVFKEKSHRGDLVHFAPRDKDKKVGKGGKKGTRAVYMVKVSAGVTEDPKGLQVAGRRDDKEAEPTSVTAATLCFYTCMPAANAPAAAAATAPVHEASTKAPLAGPEAEASEAAKEAAEAATEAAEAAHEASEAAAEAATGTGTLSSKFGIKTLDFSGSVKVSEKSEECEKEASAAPLASTPENRSKQLLDINFDQLMEDNARVYHGPPWNLQVEPRRHKKAKEGDSGGVDGKFYALPELGARYKAEEMREMDSATSVEGVSAVDLLQTPLAAEATTLEGVRVDLKREQKKKAVTMAKAKAPPENLAMDVQQQLRGGAVEMPGVGESYEVQEEDEDAEEDDDDGGAVVRMTERDVFRGDRRRSARKADGGGDADRTDVNMTVELSNQTFSPPAFSCEGRGGRFPDPSSVHRYYSCAPSLDGASFQATRLICPAGRVFDSTLGECVRKHQGAEDVLPPASAARPPPPPPCPADRVLDRSSGMCVRTDATTPQCPAGTVYDRNTGECRREPSLDLIARLLPPWPHVAPRSLTSPWEEPQRCLRPGRVENPLNCSSFFLCVPRRRDALHGGAGGGDFLRLLVGCPGRSVFDPGSGRCVPGSPQTCLLRLRRCQRPGRFARTDAAPGVYVLCTRDLTPLRMHCPRGQVFSRRLRHCVVT